MAKSKNKKSRSSSSRRHDDPTRETRRSRRYKMSKNQKKRFLTEILSEVAPPKRRIRDKSFNYSAEDNLYATLQTKAFTRYNDHEDPQSGSVLKEDGIAIFKITTGENEFIKLRDLPLQMGYRIEQPQTPVVAGDDKANGNFLTANFKDHFKYGINPVPGVSGFLHKAEVIMNGTVITDTVGLGSHSDVYKSINQKMANNENRMRDQTSFYMSRQKDRYEIMATQVTAANGTVTTKYNPSENEEAMETAQALMHLSSYNSDSDLIYENFAFDGYPLLSLPRNNALANLDRDETGEERNKMKYIPPNTEVVIRINFRSEFYCRIDNYAIKDNVYFSNTDVTAAMKKFNVIIKELKINFERYVPSDKNFSMAFDNMSCKIPFDSPSITSYHYSPGAANQQFKVTLEPGSKGVFLVFSYAHNIWCMPTTNKPVRNDFVFPPQLNNLRLRLPGHGYLIAENIGPLSGQKGYANPVLRSHWLNLKSKGVVSGRYEEFMNRKTNNYNQILFVDLRPYPLTDNTDLMVDAYFTAADSCPAQMHLFACSVRQHYIQNEGRKWSVMAVVP